jgi:hypothetical protein
MSHGGRFGRFLFRVAGLAAAAGDRQADGKQKNARSS